MKLVQKGVETRSHPTTPLAAPLVKLFLAPMHQYRERLPTVK